MINASYIKIGGEKMRVISKKKDIRVLKGVPGPAGQNTNAGWGCGC